MNRTGERGHDSQWAAIRSIVEKIGCSLETLRHWARAVERDTARGPGLATDARLRLNAWRTVAFNQPLNFGTMWLAEMGTASHDAYHVAHRWR